MWFLSTQVLKVFGLLVLYRLQGNTTNLESKILRDFGVLFVFPLLTERTISVCLSYFRLFHMSQDRHFNPRFNHTEKLGLGGMGNVFNPEHQAKSTAGYSPEPRSQLPTF